MRTEKNNPEVNPSRREFLKTSLATVSAGAVGASGIGQRVHAAGSDVIKIGMIGCGGRCTGAAIDALRADTGVRLIAMADVFAERVETAKDAIKERLPDQFDVDREHSFVGLDGYRKVIESGVDAVLIACASVYHPDYAKAALEAGKHVFVEKPHGIDPSNIRVVRETIALAKEKNLTLISGLHNRYDPGVQETMRRIQDGAIGEIVAIEENFLRPPYVLRGRKEGDSETEYQFRNWYHFSWLSGDDVTQSLVHNLDKALWVLGEKPPAYAHGLAGRSSMFDEVCGDVFDHHSVVYDYDSGVKIYALCRTQDDCHNGVSDIIMGTKGRCDLLRYSITGETNWQYDGPRGGGHARVQQAMIQGIRSGNHVVSEYMADSTMTAILGQMACYSGKRIACDEACRSSFTFGPKNGNFETPPPKVPDANGSYPVAVPGQTNVL